MEGLGTAPPPSLSGYGGRFNPPLCRKGGMVLYRLDDWGGRRGVTEFTLNCVAPKYKYIPNVNQM